MSGVGPSVGPGCYSPRDPTWTRGGALNPAFSSKVPRIGSAFAGSRYGYGTTHRPWPSSQSVPERLRAAEHNLSNVVFRSVVARDAQNEMQWLRLSQQPPAPRREFPCYAPEWRGSPYGGKTKEEHELALAAARATGAEYM